MTLREKGTRRGLKFNLAHRLLRLLQRLQCTTQITELPPSAELAKVLGVGERCVEQDLELLASYDLLGGQLPLLAGGLCPFCKRPGRHATRLACRVAAGGSTKNTALGPRIGRGMKEQHEALMKLSRKT